LNIEQVLKTAFVLLVGMTPDVLLAGYPTLLEVSKLSCGIRMSLSDSAPVVEGKSPEYRVHLDGTQMRLREEVAAIPLEGRAAGWNGALRRSCSTQ